MRAYVQSVSKSLTIEKPFYKFESHWCIMVCSFKMTVSSVVQSSRISSEYQAV